MWLIVVVVVFLAVLLAAATVVVRGRAPLVPEDPDPLYVTGIAMTGASAALIATVGYAALTMTALGLVCIGIGTHRRAGRHRL